MSTKGDNMKKSLLMLATILAIPAMLCSCSKKADKPAGGDEPVQPAHVHERDEFGICECGDIEEVAGIRWAYAGQSMAPTSTEGGRIELFKIAGAPGHKFSFSLKRFMKINLVKWVENGEVKKVESPTTSTNFEPSVSLTYYVETEVEADNDGNCFFKYAWSETPTHTPNEYGICECNSFVGKQAHPSSDGSGKDALAYLATYNAYGEGIDWYTWQVGSDNTSMYIGGDDLATRHTIGLWYSADSENFTKISDSGYNITFTRDNADENKKLKDGTYILKVSKSSMGIQETAALKVKLYTA